MIFVFSIIHPANIIAPMHIVNDIMYICILSTCAMYLIIINVTHISMFRNYSFNFGRNVAKRGRNMERRRERNIAEPKFELKSFRLSSCVFYDRSRI